MDFDYSSIVRDLDHALDKALNEGLESGEFGVDMMGRSHDPKIICSNQAYDKYTNDTIQTDSDMLELSYRKLETLIEGTLGDMVKIEDLSLKPLTFAERSWWLLTGFFRSRRSTTWLTT
jgi:hypothetical protein